MRPGGDPLLKVTDVDVRYSGVHALRSVSFEVARGSVHAVVGPNGAGKTTLLDVVAGLTRPASGSVTLDGRELIGVSAAKRARAGIGRSFQHAALVGDLTVRENVAVAAKVRKGEVFTAEEALTNAGVRSELWDEGCASLTAGQQKLVDFSRAVVQNPVLLLLDEPTSGVTRDEAEELARCIADARARGITVLLIDHDIWFVRSLADRVTVLDFGQVIADGETAEVFESGRVVDAFLGGEGNHV